MCVGGGHADHVPLVFRTKVEALAVANSLAGHGVVAVNDSHTHLPAETLVQAIDALPKVEVGR